MQRFTVKLKTTEPKPDVERIKAVIRRELIKAMHLFELGAIAHSNGSIMIELRAEGKKQNLAEIITNCEEELKASLEDVSWGWLITGSPIADIGEIKVGDVDPYASTQAQLSDTREYVGSIGLVFEFAAFFIISTLSVAAALFIVRPLVPRILAALCVAVAFVFAPAPKEFFGYGLLNHVISVRCQRHSLDIRYWLRPPKKLMWSDICGLRVVYSNGLWCRVQTREGREILPVVLPLGRLRGLKDSPTLVKTILERASLQFVKSSRLRDINPWKAIAPSDWYIDAIYKHFDAPQ